MICPNCCANSDRFGFSAVIVPFRTFVCNNCKSAHQSFSHRCKSVTMSNWTMEEVRVLEEASGGGNRIATLRWFAGLPANEARLGLDAHHTVLKSFIDRAYNRKEWEGTPASRAISANCRRMSRQR